MSKNLEISIKKGESDKIMVSFSYNPELVLRIKRHKWHPEGKYWGLPGSLDRIFRKES